MISTDTLVQTHTNTPRRCKYEHRRMQITDANTNKTNVFTNEKRKFLLFYEILIVIHNNYYYCNLERYIRINNYRIRYYDFLLCVEEHFK